MQVKVITRSCHIVGKASNPKLQAIADFFPGKTAMSKAAMAAGVAATSAALIQSGYYIPGEDTFAVLGFAIFARVFYMKLGKPIGDYLGNEVWSEREGLIRAIQNSKNEAINNIQILESFKDNLDVNSALFDIKRENVMLEAAVAELSQKVKLVSELKSKVQEIVAKDKQRTEAERRAFNEAVKKELFSMLQKPEIQERILQQSIRSLETLPINAI